MKQVVFVLDSLRADHVSHLGYSRETTPNIDSVAADGVAFENAFSQAMWTGPSSGSIIASQYPLVHRTGFMYRKKEPPQSIAQPFQDSGHITGCISPMRALGSDRYGGFDEHADLYKSDLDWTEMPKKLTNLAAEFIEEHYAEDFFLFVWTSGTHTPYITPEEYIPEFSQTHGENTTSMEALKSAPQADADVIRNHYDDSIRYTDSEFGRIIGKLREHEIYDETAITVTADHGEIFDEHYRLEHSRPLVHRAANSIVPASIKSQFKLFEPSGWLGHQAILPYDELLHVPLVQKLPGNENAGNRVAKLAQTLDIGPTLHDIAEFEQMDTAQGKSLLPAITKGETVNEYVYSSSPMLMGLPVYHSIRDESMKYVRVERKPFTSQVRRELRNQPLRFLFSALSYHALPRELLFETELGEETNIANENTSELTRFRDEFNTWKTTSVREVSDDVVSEDTMDHLEDLGYVN